LSELPAQNCGDVRNVGINSDNPEHFYIYKSKRLLTVSLLKNGDKFVIDDTQETNILNNQ